MIAALLIAGPTASGKSGLASSLAESLGATIVNANSMQVYRDLQVLTARPTSDEERRVPHLLYGHVDAAQNYSVGRWLASAAAALAETRAAGRLPIFVGGTGLYFKALTQGLSDIPSVPAELRARLRAAAQGVASAELHRRLAALDPATAAALRLGDRQRILRALEVFEAVRVPLSQFHQRRGAPLIDSRDCLSVFLAPERPVLYAGIDRRFEAMIERGALEEVRKLAARGLDPALPAMRAHGVPHLIAHLKGGMTLAEAVRLSVLDTRHYAKRQFTFFRHQLPDFCWVAPEEAEAIILHSLAAQAQRAR